MPSSRHWPYSNYGSGSWFGNVITYTGAGGIKFRGDTTYAYKFENNNDDNLFEIEASIGNRTGPDSDLELNPVGNGGMKVDNSVSMAGSGKWIKVYGTKALELAGPISGDATLAVMQGATVTLTGGSANTFTGDARVESGILRLQKTAGVNASRFSSFEASARRSTTRYWPLA